MREKWLILFIACVAGVFIFRWYDEAQSCSVKGGVLVRGAWDMVCVQAVK